VKAQLRNHIKNPGNAHNKTTCIMSDLNLCIGLNRARNFDKIYLCPYMGRGIVLGKLPNGNFCQLYFVTGRSESSQNRVLAMDPDGVVRTNYADPSKGGGDPDLIIYPAAMDMGISLAESRPPYVVTNGNQTMRFITGLRSKNRTVAEVNAGLMYEPDPSGTSRISGIIHDTGNGPEFWFAIARKHEFTDACEHVTTRVPMPDPGLGWCTVTYAFDSPTPNGLIPAFRRSVFAVPLAGTAEEVADSYWEMLGEKLRVALMVKEIFPDGSCQVTLRNRHQLVAV
jgi:IMP cyclohydrolase